MSGDQQVLSEIQRRIAQLADQLGAALADLSALFAGVPPAVEAALPPRLKIPTGGPLAAPVPIIQFSSLLDALNYLTSIGVKQRPFDGHVYAVATEPLNNKGNVTKLQRLVDEVMVSPSIDAQIEFDTDINPATPVVSGGTVFVHPVRTKEIHHKASSATLTGTLTFFGYWWN